MKKVYYGEQTKKALKNFPYSIHRVNFDFIKALLLIKKSATWANWEAGKITRQQAVVIAEACEKLLSENHEEQFLLPALQGGAGTSINMNVNEVVANLANEILEKKEKVERVHPNDHVNCSMSTNDANPSAIKIASLFLIENLIASLKLLVEVMSKKSKEFKSVQKLGRTHLQDAVPTTLGAEFASYEFTLRRHLEKLKQVSSYLLELNLGGTAIGNSINAGSKYTKAVYKYLNKFSKRSFKPAKNLMSQTSSQTDFLAVSQAVTALCVDLSKIANDIRLLSSGPKGGLGEIKLRELQNGSSIMPGKVNPVLAENVNQLYFWVSGNNLAIEHSAEAAQLELGVMLPTIADKLLESLAISSEVIKEFALNCVLHIQVDKKKVTSLLENSTAYATLFAPLLGYDKVSEMVKKSLQENKNFKTVILENKILSEDEFDKIIKNFK